MRKRKSLAFITLILCLFMVACVSQITWPPAIQAGQNLTFPYFQAFDSNGAPLSGGLVYTYTAGGSVARATYPTAADASAGTNANTNPVILDSDGKAAIYLSGTYKITLKTAAGVTLWTKDLVQGQGASVLGVRLLSDYASLSAAVTVIGVTETTLWLDTDDTMGADINIPVTLVLQPMNGNTITTTGYTLTINSPFPQVSYQVFSGTGSVVFPIPPVINVKWFGAKGLNDTGDDDQPAIQQAITAAQTNTQQVGKVYVPTGIYYLGDTLTLMASRDLTFYGDGRSTVLCLTANDKPVIYLNNANMSSFRDFVIAATGTGSIGIQLNLSHDNNFDNISSVSAAATVLLLEGSIYNKFNRFAHVPATTVPGLTGTIRTPVTGLDLTSEGAVGSNLNTFIDCRWNSVSGKGIHIRNNSVSNTFIGCATQGSGTTDYGVYVEVTLFGNTFINHYFAAGTYDVLDLYDKGNRTTWISPYGVAADPGIVWSQYGDNRHFALGSSFLEFLSDVKMVRTAANKMGFAASDTLDLATNKNVLLNPVLNVAQSAGATVNIPCSGATAAKHVVITVADNVGFTITINYTPQAGQELIVDVYNNSGGAMGAITWSGTYFLMAGWADPASGKRKTVQFYYDATLTKWVQVGPPSADL